MSSPRSFSPSVSCCQPATLTLWLSTAFCLSFAVATPETAADQNMPSESERLVAAAVQAEVAGDIGQYLTLLQAAVRSDPNNKVPRWQLGQVQVGKDWVPAEEAQRRSANDPLQAEYRQRRAAASDSFLDQIRLARWCRDNKLNDEAELHWMIVLSHDPSNKEAQRAVDMLWKGGRLVSRKEPSEQKQRAQAMKNAAKHWEPIIAKWRRAVDSRDGQAHDQALTEIRAISRLDAIPSMEAVTLGRDAHDPHHAEECLQIAVAFLEALSQMPQQAATQSIVRHAVLSPGNKAKSAAIAELKKRDQHDYVPMLLAGLAMPIESSYHVQTAADGSIHYIHSLYREGQDADWSFDLRRSAVQFDLGGKRVRYDTYTGKEEVGPSAESPIVIAAKQAAVATAYENRYGANAMATENRISDANQAIENLNSLIFPVLAATTGQSIGDSAKAWWDWWRNQNEYYESEHPVEQQYSSGTDSYYYGFPKYETYSSAPPPPPLPPGRRSHSCFAKGTPVWTKTGRVPIESVELGDFVLSQDVNTGELTYKPVLAKTVRPPSKMLSISLDGEDITTTLGHPFWVAGTGWRMAKELGDGAQLHGVSGAKRVSTVKLAEEAEAYNLVVADNSTYFVGKSGLLVHDNTPRESAPVIIPGVSKE